jgi:type III restriction enzyme
MKQIDQLIICSPYRVPDKFWTRDESTQEFSQQDGRRPAGFTIAGTGKGDNQIGTFVELPLVNIIRKRLADWKENGRPGITGVSQELLEHWYDKEKRNYPFFFCQLEAIETIIFLNEAPANYTSGLEIPGDGGEFVRWCSKMATGSGKTIVMAMLIAYNVLNKVSYRQDTRFSKNILIVAPGLTVKTRLAVLDPTAENNYYNEFQVVPSTLMEKLREGRVKIINWHMLAWDTQEKLNDKIERKQIRSVDKRKQIELSDTAYTKQVLGDMANAPDILVLNDEAHHAWRSAAESKVKGVAKDEIDNTVWVGGLDKLGRKIKILRCHDLSATPFAPTGKKTTEVGLFDWIISDFGLNDAIESGLVKTPRVVLRDDGKLSSDYRSRLYHIYMDQDVKDDINQKQVPKETPLPQLVANAYDLLATDWLKTKEEWIKNGITNIPPVLITIANTTITANRIKHYFDSKSCIVKEICELDKTLQIDSKILGSIENEDETLTGSKAELATALREKVDTVGKENKPGQHIQNVISVGMLSEGWDAKNVTQIMGLRAFSSQLLCEQVVGRGLRRVSYDFDENGMLGPEYVNIFGVPFSFIPHEGGVASPRPPKPKFLIEPSKSKQDFKITFPNILRVDTVYQSRLSIDYGAVKPIEIDPSETITRADLGGVIDSDVTPAALTDVDLKVYAEKYRMQSVIFRVATTIYGVEKHNWKGNQYDFMHQLLKLTEEFIQSGKIRIKTDLFNQDPARRNILLTLNMQRIIQHFGVALKGQNAEVLEPVFDKEKPIRSTLDMPTWYTSKPNIWHEKSHINYTVFDSTWEGNNANILDTHEAVKAFVKNDHLGFSIKYHFKGVVRNYYPDYIIHLKNGDYLILEVKGQDSDETRAKRDFLNLWVKAVNQTNKFGTWHWAVVFNSHEIHDILSKYKEFPAESFLPVKEKQTEVVLVENSTKLSAFFDLSVDDLRKEKSVEAMVQRVMKEMLSKNIDEIFNVIKEASNSAGEAFIDQGSFQEKIYSQLDGLTPPDASVFENRVRSAIKEAKHLEKQSLDYLISSEFLNDSIILQMVDDFSPVVLQMSRAVESELQLKIFKQFTNYIRSTNPNIATTYSDDFRNKDMQQFTDMLLNNRTSYTLGQMHFILKTTGSKEAYENSTLAQDFHDYLIENFNPGLSKKEFLDDVFELQKKYRNKSAHVNVLSKEQAQDCKFLVRKILTKFLGMVV